MLPIRFKSDIQMRIIGLILAFLCLYFTWAYLPSQICFMAVMAYLASVGMLFEMRPEPYDLPPNTAETDGSKDPNFSIQEAFMTDVDYTFLREGQITALIRGIISQLSILALFFMISFMAVKTEEGDTSNDSFFPYFSAIIIICSVGNFFWYLYKSWADKQNDIKLIVQSSAKLIAESDGDGGNNYYIDVRYFKKIQIFLQKPPFRDWQYKEWRMDTVRHIELHLAPKSEIILSIKLLPDIL
jgi:hypothetical protein